MQANTPLCGPKIGAILKAGFRRLILRRLLGGILMKQRQHEPKKVEDLKNWSFWSVPLEESGQHPRLPWGRYFQLRVQLKTDAFFDFARLDSLQIEIAPLLADRVVGEVVLEEDHQPQGGRVRVPTEE